MKTTKILYVLIGSMLVISSSVEAYARIYSSCRGEAQVNDGKHGSPGYLEDGEDGKAGKNAQDGGRGGNGGASVCGRGGNGGNGGDAD